MIYVSQFPKYNSPATSFTCTLMRYQLISLCCIMRAGVFSTDRFKLVQIHLTFFSHLCPINGSCDLPCVHCCPSAHLHWPPKSVNQYDCLSWHKESNKMDCCSATFPGLLFSLSLPGGGRYYKWLLICVLWGNEDLVNSVWLLQPSWKQIFVFWPVISSLQFASATRPWLVFVPFWSLSHL